MRKRQSNRVPRLTGALAAVISLSVAAGASAGVAPPDGQPSTGAHAAKAKKHAQTKPLASPRLLSPADGARTDGLSAFSWAAASKAAKYEFQLSADPRFSSTLYTIQTLNTFATIDKVVTDGTYYWRVRDIDSHDVAGRWSLARSVSKSWVAAPVLLGPAPGDTVVYPTTPLVLHWSSVPRAFKYMLSIGTDPSLSSLLPGLGGKPVETSGTSFALPAALASGTYYWAVAPEDAEKHSGTRSAVGSFNWSWPTATTTSVADSTGVTGTDAAGLPEVLAPKLSWNRVSGAAAYEVEINSGADFASGSKVCCTGLTTGTSLAPLRFLPDNVYHWRMRAYDANGNAGSWNVGPDFRKQFDDALPSVGNLTVADASNGLVTWSPVSGASSYEVDVASYVGGIVSNCDWSNPVQYKTATTAWSPLASSGPTPGPVSWPSTSSDGAHALHAGTGYCLRVIARSDRDLNGHEVVSQATQIGGAGAPAFVFNPSVAPSGTLADTQASDYVTMTSVSGTADMPVFRWKPITGAQSYYVVVAKDANFTDVVDVALTNVPEYAPRTGSGVRTYPDENTHYYWQVMPAANANGTLCPCAWSTNDNHPQAFDKSSVPPTLRSPGVGADVTEQPTFAWTPAEGARNYRLQVSEDPTFSDPIDDVTTDSASFTSSSTYPADAVLYWRVRANDENNVGLNWSPVGIFRRILPTPALSAGNAGVGADIPVVTWSLVPGATSYTVHVEQGDGTTRDFATSSTAFTPVGFFGVGNVRWQVRANFPKATSGETPGGYSGLQTFTRQIPAPTGVRWVNARHHVLLSWDPSSNVGTKQYRVQISTTNSFSSVVDTHTTENTSYAPNLTAAGFRDGGTLYWRVATLDERGTLGAWASRTLTLPGRMNITVKGSLRRNRRASVRVKLTNKNGRAIRGGKVRVTGVGFHTVAKRTGKHGTVTFKLRPRRKGRLKFQGSKSGYQSASKTLLVF